MSTKDQLKQLLELCLEKELGFDLTPGLSIISVYKIVNKKHVFRAQSYYEGELKNFKCDIQDSMPLNELIEKVKEL